MLWKPFGLKQGISKLLTSWLMKTRNLATGVLFKSPMLKATKLIKYAPFALWLTALLDVEVSGEVSSLPLANFGSWLVPASWWSLCWVWVLCVSWVVLPMLACCLA